MAKLGGHKLCGIAVDDVGDLQHHALTHQELDDVDAADSHPVGQFLDGDDVRNDHFTRCASLFGGPATALFLFAFTGPANRGQGPHAFDGAFVISGNRLDCQSAFTTFWLALGAGNRLAGTGALATIVLLIGATIDNGAAWAGRGSGGALHFRRGGRGIGDTGSRTRTARCARTRRSRSGRQRRISNGFAGAGGPRVAAGGI